MNSATLQPDISRNRPGKSTILVAESDTSATRVILRASAAAGIMAVVANDAVKACGLIEKNNFDLVFISRDFLSGNSKLIDKVKIANPETPVILLADYDSGDNLADVIDDLLLFVSEGVTSVSLKPLEISSVSGLFDTLLPNRPVSDNTADNRAGDYSIIGSSDVLAQSIELVKKAAPTSAPVLLAGASGTGKELFARLVHRKSKRASRPFVAVNCAALNESVLESELFGHEKGSFTGAAVRRKGRFELADTGTLMLDEITETPISFQSKLLRVLEQQEFQRLGGNETIKVNVRLVCTTNKDLMALVRQNKFRLDLYYRICGIKIVLPSLCDRKDDLHDLVWHFVNIYSSQSNRRIKKLDTAMMEKFASYRWPGNIRQLRNVVRMLFILGSGETLSLVNLPWLFEDLGDLQEQDKPDLGSIPLKHVEKHAIIETLRRNDNNQAQAARVLGISDRTLRDKIKKYRQQEMPLHV